MQFNKKRLEKYSKIGHNIFYKYGRLAQLGERLPYKQNVSSSILLSPTKEKQSGWIAFFFFIV